MSRKSHRAAKSQRARQGGGRVVPLPTGGAPPQALSQTDGWFGPLQPPAESAPADVSGRRFDYASGYNLNQYPRAYEAIGFQELRALSDGYDLMRVAIETRKNQLARMPWSISPRDETIDLKTNTEMAARVKKYEDMLRRPDGKMFWNRWLRGVVEDLLVLDAPAVYIRRTVGGDAISLHHMDGATIKVVLDASGRTPEPPFAAYQQILKGLPARNYSTQELVYLPMNVRTHKVYGYSPVEQILMTVNIALRRQMWQLAYFTDGNIPDSLIGVPSTWTPDQIRQFQDWFDSILSGNTQRRRGATFVPGEVAKSYVPTKEAEIFGAAEEWLARVICWAFGLSHQALVKEVNRATADTAREMALEEGLGPYMAWVKELMDTILLDIHGEEDLEFTWVDEKALDPKVQSEVHTAQLGRLRTINELREELGQDPDPSPEANELGSFGTDGAWVPLSQKRQLEIKQKNMDAFASMGLGPDGQAIPPPPPEEDDGTGSGGRAPEGEGGGGASSTAKPPSAPAAAKHMEGEVAMTSRPFRWGQYP